MSKTKKYQERVCWKCFHYLRCPVRSNDEIATVCSLFRYASINAIFKPLKHNIKKAHDTHKDTVELTINLQDARLLRDLLKEYLYSDNIIK